jgi:hypothetical protein
VGFPVLRFAPIRWWVGCEMSPVRPRRLMARGFGTFCGFILSYRANFARMLWVVGLMNLEGFCA